MLAPLTTYFAIVRKVMAIRFQRLTTLFSFQAVSRRTMDGAAYLDDFACAASVQHQHLPSQGTDCDSQESGTGRSRGGCGPTVHPHEHDHPREHNGDYERTEAELYHHEPDDESKDGDSDCLRCQDLARESTSNRGRDLFDLRDIDDGNERGVDECDFDSNIENRDPDEDSDRHRFNTFQDDTWGRRSNSSGDGNNRDRAECDVNSERGDGSDSDRRHVGDFDGGVCEEDSDFAVDSSGSSAEGSSVDETVSTVRGDYVCVKKCRSIGDAHVEMQSFDDFKYTYLSSSTSPHGPKPMYRCTSHAECPVRVRLAPHGTTVSVEVKGHHNLDAAVTSSRTKIHPRFLPEIDNMLLGGSGPLTVLTSLTLAYSKTPRVLEELPTRGQIRSRRVTVMRSNAGTKSVSTFAGIRSWSSSRLCQTKEEFFKPRLVRSERSCYVDSISVEDQNKILVLDIFEHSFKDAAGLDQMSLGLIVTSRRVFYNVVASMDGQGTDVASSADGTYKLHHGPLLTSEALPHEFTQSHVHAALHPILGEVVLVAAQLLEDNTNYQQVWHPRADGRRLRGIVFNSSEYNVCFGNADDLPVTTSRTKTYMKSIQGHIPRNEKAVNSKIKYLSMYFVEINESIDIEPCNESPLRTEQEVSDDVSADF
ncbi:hypothetical protein DYB25_010996 [Aphanomyces astaci]|uniref:Uncharacterized protein n=1 Tax=Aphanomyces astaci TaxID=112090 RepID=A0A397ADS3_APHAT|nr:hypothetical protein DYB25_010996 [Aphanomyces astaci]